MAEPDTVTLEELPYPPTTNTYWRRAGRGMILSDAARAFRESVIAILFHRRMPPLTGPLKLTAIFCPPDRRRRDLDNLLKGMCDSLKYARVYEDDSQIRHIDIRFGDVEKGGSSFVMLSKIKELE